MRVSQGISNISISEAPCCSTVSHKTYLCHKLSHKSSSMFYPSAHSLKACLVRKHSLRSSTHRYRSTSSLNDHTVFACRDVLRRNVVPQAQEVRFLSVSRGKSTKRVRPCRANSTPEMSDNENENRIPGKDMGEVPNSSSVENNQQVDQGDMARPHRTELTSTPERNFWFFLPFVKYFTIENKRNRRLKALLAETVADPKNVGKESAYLEELARKDPEAVVKRFETNEHPSNEATVVIYLRSLLESGQIAKYQQQSDEIPGGSQPMQSVGELLGTLKKRAEGKREPLYPGGSPKVPLHVVMVDPRGSGNPFVRFLQNVFGSMLTIAAMMVVWSLGSSAVRWYARGGGLAVGGGAGASSMSSATPGTGLKGPGGAGGQGGAEGMNSPASFNPKEYNKDVLPEKQVRTFKDVKGCDEAKSELEEIVQYLRDPEKFTRLGGKLPKGVLLTGPPGTGKTLLARAVAGEAGVPFFYRAGSEFEEMFVGVGSRRVRSLFAAAKKKSPCIVFIDEIDAIGASRKSWESHTRKTLNQLLVEMDGFDANEGVIVLAATNLPETLDSALTRPGRFDRHIVVPNPDVKGRQEILEHYLSDKPISSEVKAETLARGTTGFSGADLYNLINMAAIEAALKNVDQITAKHLDNAKDRIVMGAERKSAVISEENRKLTAYHEGGHAIVALNTKGALPLHKATIMPRGNALGMVIQLPDKDDTSISRQQMMAKLDVCMGGRVAEELIFGADQVTSGATSDLKQATKLARFMVQNCGMSELVGPIWIETEGKSGGGALISPETERAVDSEVTRLLKESYARVTLLLKEKEAQLHKLSKALIEHETLNRDQIHEALLEKMIDTAKPPPSDGGSGTVDFQPEAMTPSSPELATSTSLSVDDRS